MKINLTLHEKKSEQEVGNTASTYLFCHSFQNVFLYVCIKEMFI